MTGESAWNDSRCHAERSEASMSGFLTASMSGFLAALAMTKDKCRTECCKTYTFICQSYNAT
jgi:hypothetical protein